jgi:hypothetical protein
MLHRLSLLLLLCSHCSLIVVANTSDLQHACLFASCGLTASRADNKSSVLWLLLVCALLLLHALRVPTRHVLAGSCCCCC